MLFDHMGGGFGWLFFVMPIVWILVIGLVVWLVSMGARRSMHDRRMSMGGGMGPWMHGGSAASAEQTLSERFAKGDIDEAEYRARLEVLRANRPNLPNG